MSLTKPTKQGVVVSISGKNTIKVQVEASLKNFTGKVINTFHSYIVHDADSKAKLNDVVLITEGRKISKTKSWHLKEVILHEGAQ